MVYFWPFGSRDGNSPDSFERALSRLAAQIDAASKKLAILRQRARRHKALLTLYSVFGYILYAVLVFLLVGYQNIRLYEGSGLFGGPFGIYLGRKLLDIYYSGRITSVENRLAELQSRQRDTIEQLKAATKYSTTQSLIEKYGGITTIHSSRPKGDPTEPSIASPIPQGSIRHHVTPPMEHVSEQKDTRLSPDETQQDIFHQQLLSPNRSGTPAQPRKPQSPPQKEVLERVQSSRIHGHAQTSSIHHIEPEEATAPKWYDRLMDVIIGEDETSAKNRFALICQNCRMVNGLAPPGTRSMDDIDTWGCARCGAMNAGHKQQLGVKGSPDKRSNLPDSSTEMERPTPKSSSIHINEVTPIDEKENFTQHETVG
ncbi:hypothetical protein EDC01DRAFT_634440 [Geopyxis carbonaria]|nr:hypothetical protein EDC01DRAFT_634440 [Geopyxis carbonaria]